MTAAALWQPRSECGEQCRDDAASPRAVWRSPLRLGAVVGVLVMGLVLVPLRPGAVVRGVARAMLAVLGVRVVWRGRVPRSGSLLVANHVSWLDVVALLAVTPVRLVAKREVGGWPGVGALARLAGTIFIDRDRPKGLPATVAEVADALRAGRAVAVFPEGTTFCGAARGTFRPAMFQAAVDASAPVVPVSIRYDSTAPAFVGADTLFASLRRVARLRRLTVTLVAAPSLHPTPESDRRALARAAQASVGGGGFGLAA